MTENTAGIIYALIVAILSALISVLIVRPLKQIGIVAAMLLTNGMNVVVLTAVG